ncbi:streptomycin 6-kinase [Arthrobacter stackebrandtii]|uniref:Streptomycin 6-kinase n=1 Tax=Arthrobacter stackebrandtii TaxID=272161 RepID=A0ABS4YR84_9MICC|nr:streptomycin 6-kinase [Arthrobacter stackebrandtii]PYH00134.1 aminoglycoside resistance protein [Arthrobacter stackebrandtii]
MTPRIEVPEALRRRHRQSAEGRHWLGKVPGYIDQALDQWALRLDLPPGGGPWHGHTGVVVPVLTADGLPAALKVAFPHDEALLEPLALELWGGSGAVRLLASDAVIGAILLERLDERRSLLQLPMEEAIPVWGAVMKELQIHPDARAEWRELPHIAATAERYSDELPQAWTELGEPFPRWLLEAALEVCHTRGAVGRRSSNDVLVHTDLHYENVLARRDGGSGYLAIDPQVQVGDAEFAVAPCLWNRIQDLPALDTEAALRRRASALSLAAGLDEDLAAAWAVLREVENALAYLSESLTHDAQRSLWVASTLAGRTLPGLPSAHELHRLY